MVENIVDAVVGYLHAHGQLPARVFVSPDRHPFTDVELFNAVLPGPDHARVAWLVDDTIDGDGFRLEGDACTYESSAIERGGSCRASHGVSRSVWEGES